MGDGCQLLIRRTIGVQPRGHPSGRSRAGFCPSIWITEARNHASRRSYALFGGNLLIQRHFNSCLVLLVKPSDNDQGRLGQVLLSGENNVETRNLELFAEDLGVIDFVLGLAALESKYAAAGLQ